MAKHDDDDDDLARWSRLSRKQHEVLDLIVARKTSKEIARILGISQSAVEQRFAGGRTILGAADRNEAAQIYSRLKQTCNQIPCNLTQVPSPPIFMPSDFPDGDPSPVLELHDSGAHSFKIETEPREFLPPSWDIWRHDHSIQARIVILAGIILAMLIVVGMTLVITDALTRLYSN